MVRRASGIVEELPATGITLGVVDDLGGKAQRLTLEKGDLMVMHTDGLTEVRDSAGTFYGEERPAGVIERDK